MRLFQTANQGKRTPTPIYFFWQGFETFACMKDLQTISPRDYYHSLYEEWKASGISVGLFCKQSSVKYATFRYWSKKFGQEKNVDTGFTELRVSDPEPEPVAVLNFPNGTRLSFQRLPDTAWLRALIS